MCFVKFLEVGVNDKFFRGTENGNEFMCKQELIDAAEASGLSRVPIMYVVIHYISSALCHLCLIVMF